MTAVVLVKNVFIFALLLTKYPIDSIFAIAVEFPRKPRLENLIAIANCLKTIKTTAFVITY